MFGRGLWRPLPRHVICQGDKWRPIDDGKSAQHNAAVSMSETIVCQSNEFHALACRRLAQHIDRLLAARHVSLVWPTWLQLCAGLDDMWKGYRQDHCHPSQQCMCVITFVHPKTRSRGYSVSFGLPSGWPQRLCNSADIHCCTQPSCDERWDYCLPITSMITRSSRSANSQRHPRPCRLGQQAYAASSCLRPRG